MTRLRRVPMENPPAGPAAPLSAMHAPADAWRRAAPGAPAPSGVDVLQSARATAVYRLTGARPNGGDIIAKRCRKACAAVERTVYEGFLARARVTAPRWFGHAPDEDTACHWLFLEDAGEGEYRRDLPEHRALAGRWLAALQTAAMESGLEHRLPDRSPAHYQALLRTVRSALRPHLDGPAPPEADTRLLAALVVDLDLLEAHWDEIEARCAPLPRTLVHGDLVRKNLRVRGGDELALLAFDWENAGWGAPCGDLAQFAGKTSSPDLDAYRTAHGGLPATVGAAALREAAHCGAYFRVLDAIAWVGPLPVDRPRRYLAKPMADLRIYQGRLHAALVTSGWTR